MLSIIIPTLNEEEYLPALLESIKKQDFNDYEIIVADAGSKDKTVEIARKYGCIVAVGGLPAKSRNNGAQIAKGDILFFLDADTNLSDGFLKKSLDEFQVRELDIASFCLHPFPEKKVSYFLVNTFYNIMILGLEKIQPHGAIGILIKTSLFKIVRGYNEQITIAEDHDFARRAGKIGKFGIIKSVELLFSDRRFVKDGWMITGAKYFLCALHEMFLGPVKSNIFNYKFNHYKKDE